MVQINPAAQAISPARPQRLFYPQEPPVSRFPIQAVEIDSERLVAKRPLMLETVETMPAYLIKPEVLALTPNSFKADAWDFGVILKTLKQRPGRPRKAALACSPKRYVPIVDHRLQDRIQSYLYAGHFRQGERIFKMARQTVNRIRRAVERVRGAPFPISCHTFRHLFAIHLLLHGRPLKYVGQLLGHKSTDSTEIYTNVLTIMVKTGTYGG